jgi:RimJ/RimL family protein N-acetyltransferase
MTGSPFPVPVVETQRLRLRAHHPDDLPASAAMWGDPAVTRYIGGHPLNTEECWSRLLRFAGHWSWLGFGYWAIEEKDTGDLVGEVGFAQYKRDLEAPHPDAPEIGWVLAPRHHRKGYATEAVQAAVVWGDANFGISPTGCIIHPENVASIRVAEKCGFRQAQLTAYKGKPTLAFVREPEAARAPL